MIIDFSELIHGKKEDISFKEQLFTEKIFSKEEAIIFCEPILAQGKIYIKNDTLILKGNIKSKVKLQCGRCLEHFNYSLEFPFQEEIPMDQENVNGIENEKIDFSSVLWENIILNLPIRAICNESCKGICPTCGKNLNNESCNCVKEDVDPRLASLKELFKEK